MPVIQVIIAGKKGIRWCIRITRDNPAHHRIHYTVETCFHRSKSLRLHEAPHQKKQKKQRVFFLHKNMLGSKVKSRAIFSLLFSGYKQLMNNGLLFIIESFPGHHESFIDLTYIQIFVT